MLLTALTAQIGDIKGEAKVRLGSSWGHGRFEALKNDVSFLAKLLKYHTFDKPIILI